MLVSRERALSLTRIRHVMDTTRSVDEIVIMATKSPLRAWRYKYSAYCYTPIVFFSAGHSLHSSTTYTYIRFDDTQLNHSFTFIPYKSLF